MAGIYGIFSKKKQKLENIYNYFYSSTFEHTINEEFNYNNFIYGRSVIDKFLDDRVLFEDDNIIIGFEGILYNKLSNKSYVTILKWYQDEGVNFIENIKGQFCGFIYDKRLDKLSIYNDHLSTKPLYVYHSDEIFIFASELKVITKLLSKLNIRKELDYDAVYSMLTFGYMLNDITYEKNTKKLDYSTIVEIDKDLTKKEKKYFQYRKEENFDLSKQEIIKKIDNLLTKSVKECWEKDDEYNYEHYSFLSGGLDSRVNLFLAKELGYNDILTMTFSQPGSSDEKIAQEISNKESFKHLFYSLDNGKFLEQNLKCYIFANDGLNMLIGSAAGFDFLSNINHEKFGALHTGQIGDLLFGSYVKKNFVVTSGIVSNQFQLLNKVSILKNYAKQYNNHSELFGYEQRVVNGTLNGDRTISHFTDSVSPFYSRELIEFCLNIPNKYKKDEAIYLDWLNTNHKNVSNYIWESAGVKPKNIYIVNTFKKIRRYKNAALRRMGFNIDNMNPFDVWIRNNGKIVDNLDSIYYKHIDNIDDKNLKKELIKMYSTDIKYSHYGRNNKFLVVTLLLAIELHFGDIA